MKYGFKIECFNASRENAENFGVVNTFEVSDDNLRDTLGKVLYALECVGFDFETGKVYDEAIAKFEASNVQAKFVSIYKDEVVKISVKSVA